jgi:hypothetical protein
MADLESLQVAVLLFFRFYCGLQWDVLSSSHFSSHHRLNNNVYGIIVPCDVNRLTYFSFVSSYQEF